MKEKLFWMFFVVENGSGNFYVVANVVERGLLMFMLNNVEHIAVGNEPWTFPRSKV